MTFNYHVVWASGKGYSAQILVPGGDWLALFPWRASHVEASLDCKLDARLRGIYPSINPVVQPCKEKPS